MRTVLVHLAISTIVVPQNFFPKSCFTNLWSCRICSGESLDSCFCSSLFANYYIGGKGVRRNLAKGMHWYKRAFRRGEAVAANNIGITWRNKGKSQRALSWFKKGGKLGDAEANLEIVKYYSADGSDSLRRQSAWKKLPINWCNRSWSRRSNQAAETNQKETKAISQDNLNKGT